MAKIGTINPNPIEYSGVIIPEQMLVDKLARNSKDSITYIIRKHSGSSYSISVINEHNRKIISTTMFSDMHVIIEEYSNNTAQLILQKHGVSFETLYNVPINGWEIQ